MNNQAFFVCLCRLSVIATLIADFVPTQADAKWGSPKLGLQYQAEATQRTFTVDEPIIINLNIKSATGAPVLYFQNSPTWKAFRVVVTLNGQPVPLTKYGRLTLAQESAGETSPFSSQAIVIQPWHALQFHFWINRLYDMSLAGNYQVSIADVDRGRLTGKRTSSTASFHVTEAQRFNRPETSLDIPTSVALP